jgi:hypothetical protein
MSDMTRPQSSLIPPEATRTWVGKATTAAGAVWQGRTTMLTRLHPSRWLTLGAIAGVAGTALMAIANIVTIALNPSYSPIQDSISQMGLSQVGWLQSVGFYLFALLLIPFAISLHHGLPQKPWLRISLFIFILISICFVLVGAFHTTPPGMPLGVPDIVHLASAFTVSFLLPLACFFTAPGLRADPRWRRLFFYTLASGILALGCNATIGLTHFQVVPLSLWFGLIEWAGLINGIVWMEVISIHFLRLTRKERRAEPEAAAKLAP